MQSRRSADDRANGNGNGGLRRQLAKLALSTVVIFLAAGAIVVAAGLWLLDRGPIALTFLTPRVQQTLNENLTGMRVSLGDVIIERDADSGRPRFRLRNLVLRDDSGNMLARAPRAAVEVNGRALLSGDIVAHQLELIGARLLVRRKLDGSFRLGFGDTGDSGTLQAPGTPRSNKSAKSDTQVPAGTAPAGTEIQGGELLQFINEQLAGDNPNAALAELQAVLISKASISLFDEANSAVWFAPKANLVFKRASYGFALFIDASVASGVKPWRTEVVTTYRREARRFTLSARVFDLVPADIADDVFALSQLTKFNVPLSGHAEFELTENGIVTKASAELSSKAGRVEFPGFISEPLIIDEGLLRFDYEPASGDVVIGNSAIFVGGHQTELQGRLQPRRAADGRLDALRIILRAHNVSMDAAGDDTASRTFDQVDFTGVAAIDAARLDIEDLILHSGNAGIRIRGRFAGEDGNIGVYLAGRFRDVPEVMIKKLWPPVVAAGTRRWIRENVTSANFKDGSFQLAIPGAELYSALKDKTALRDEVADVRFTLENVTTGYFRELPAIAGAHGEGRITGDNFSLRLEDGKVTLPSGAQLDFVEGTMTSTNLVPPVTPSVIRVRGRGKASAFLELLDHKPLGLVSEAGFDPGRVGGDGQVDIRFDIPMQKGLTGDKVKITAKSRLDNATFKNIANGLDVKAGKFALGFGDSEITAKGPARIGDIPVTLDWKRKLAKNGTDSDEIILKATLDKARRKQLGADVSSYLTGPVPIVAKAQTRGGRIEGVNVTADLAKTSLKFAPLRWGRAAGKGAKAVFDIDFSDPKRTRVRNLSLKGRNLAIKGEMDIAADGTVVEANFPTILLNEQNHFALGLQRRNDNLALAVTGKAIDARPMINAMFSPGKSGDGAGAGGAELPTAVNVSVGRVYANRGEVISNLNGQVQVVGGVVRQSNLKGTFLNGAPITLRVNPGAGGRREMRITGRDGGGALRAANLYSKIANGTIDFQAIMGSSSGGIDRGLLILRNFEVRNEVVLHDIDKKSRKAGPRRQSLKFSKLELPFSTDRQFVRIGDALIKSAELGASAQGIIRKADGAMDIGGTIIPAYALNAALGEVPILGQILVGGKGQGVFGLNFALKGSMKKPKFVINPVSAIAPGILRQFFQIGGGGVAADGTPAKPKSPTGEPKTDR